MEQKNTINLVNPRGKICFLKPVEDGLINVLNFENFVAKHNKCQAFAFNYDGSMLFVLDIYKNLILFQIKNQRYSVISKSKYNAALLTVKCGKEYLCIVKENKYIDVFSLSDSTFVHSLPGHKLKIQGLRYNAIKNLLLSHSAESFYVWDIPSFKTIKGIFLTKSKFLKVIFSEDGLFIIALENDNHFSIYDIGSYQIIHTVQLNQLYNISEVACCNESKNIIFGGEIPFFLVYNVSTKEISEKMFQSPKSQSLLQMRLSYNNYLIVLHDKGLELNIYDISNDLKLFVSFNLPSNLIITNFEFDFENNHICFVTNLGSIFLYDFRIFLQSLKNKPMKANFEGTFSLSNFSPFYQTLETDHDKINRIIEQNPKITQSPQDVINFRSEESSQSFKENVSIGYLNQSIKDQKSVMPSFKSTKNYDKLNNSKNLDIKNSLLNKTHLTNYLKNYKLFPEKHRLFIWKNILILPENKEAFDNLISRGISKEFCDLYQKYQLTSENLFRKLQRILSALVNYNAAFLQVPFLQDMIFPFIKLFSQNELWCFELILSFFLNWGQHFFEYSPNPPIKYFKCIDEIIKFIDLDFWKFLQSQKISSLNLIWPSFQVLFTDILTKEEWLSFMDYMILNQNKPEILLCFSAIFLLSYKEKLMQDSEIKGLSCYEKSFFMEKQILLVDKLVNQLPEELLELSFKQNLPLLKDQYPIYNFYPLYDLNEHRKMREKIIEEEEKYQQDKNRLDLKKINLFSTKLLKEQESLQENYRAFNRKIDDERDLLSLEQELTLKKQMEVNQALTHDKILKMEQNENVLKRNLQNQIQRREEQKKLLEKDLEFNKKIEDLRIGSTIKKESLNNLEFETFLKLNDLVKKREKSEEKKNLLQNLNFFEKKEFFENCLNQEKQTKEKQLLLLKKDLDSKKNIVQDYVGDDLLKKRTIINNLLLGQMQTELNKTRENNFWDLEHELEKEKIKINEYEELKKELEISQKEKNVNKTKENHI